MKCPKCAKEGAGGTFCAGCGTRLPESGAEYETSVVESRQPADYTARGEIACPQCGSTELQITTQSESSGGGIDVKKGLCYGILLGPLGLLCAQSKKETKHTDYWVCKKCGHKFLRQDR
ncbi:MAG: hypothetical protein LBS90_07420 [Oscillospiraceae bacterium]|jgi:DNA-directed RNA polymerase subunit RPC12/RpoP|nr:hypothetical protein [Oscillospiraceae bacterium]